MSLTMHGVRVVADQEVRRRVRAGRWRWLISIWFAVLVLFTLLLRLTLNDLSAHDEEFRGAIMYGGLQIFILALALLIVPALTAQTVNGDRERGVLATLQVTLLSPAEIAVGKLVAAWGAALVFLLVSLPVVFWCMAEGGVPLVRVVAVTAVMGLILGVVCAVAEAMSALLARSTTSAVMSYLAVFALTFGTLILFGVGVALDTQTVDDEFGSHTDHRTDRVWVLLAPNPFVIVADAAPVTEALEKNDNLDPLGSLGRTVRDLRDSPDAAIGGFTGLNEPDDHPGAVWPWGLLVNIAVGVGAVALTTQRLRTPSRELPRGSRVA